MPMHTDLIPDFENGLSVSSVKTTILSKKELLQSHRYFADCNYFVRWASGKAGNRNPEQEREQEQEQEQEQELEPEKEPEWEEKPI